MSRIGKKPILISAGVEVKIEGNKVTVKGPKGELVREFSPEIEIKLTDNLISLTPKKGRENVKEVKALFGLTRMLIFNMVEGVTNGFEKNLQLEGVGYKSEVNQDEFILHVGFSHPVVLKIPQGVEVEVKKNIISVRGVDKELVGQFSANVKKVRPVEPYKGKGIKYEGEIVRRKVGKKAAAEIK